MDTASQITIEENTFSNVMFGVNGTALNNCNITSNTFEKSILEFHNSNNSDIYNNNIFNNTNVGISIHKSINIFISFNSISKNKIGIKLYDVSDNNEIGWNDFYKNYNGMKIGNLGSYNLIEADL